MKVLGAIVAGVVASAATILGVFAFGMRTKSPRILGAIRRMNRAYVNPRQRDAGTPGAYASLIGHTGRRTGTTYETPVVAEPTDDGFVIALPYGSQADWLRNILASGAATLTHEGRTYELFDPEVVPTTDVDDLFPPADRRAHRIFGTTECLRLRTSPRSEPAPSTA
jgi:deazaflavin-dependent oxidoreductase (nitroreductase family)